jgi:hypothetical protein
MFDFVYIILLERGKVLLFIIWFLILSENNFVCFSSNRQTIFITPDHGSTRDVIVTLFGVKQLQSLCPINWKMGQLEIPNEEIFLSGFLSKLGEGRTTPDRQYIFLNKRPCKIPKVKKKIIWSILFFFLLKKNKLKGNGIYNNPFLLFV